MIFLLPVAFKTREIIENLARNSALPIITSTLASCEVQSNRGIVQNEALIALNIVVMLADGEKERSSSEETLHSVHLESICQKLKEANFHENLKAFLREEVEHPEMMNNFLQLIHLIKKQGSVYSNPLLCPHRLTFSPLCLAHLLTKDELHEYKSLLENLRVSQNCGGRRILDRTLTVIQNELE